MIRWNDDGRRGRHRGYGMDCAGVESIRGITADFSLALALLRRTATARSDKGNNPAGPAAALRRNEEEKKMSGTG